MWWLIYVNLIKALRPADWAHRNISQTKEHMIVFLFYLLPFRVGLFWWGYYLFSFQKVLSARTRDMGHRARSKEHSDLSALFRFWLLPWGWELSKAERLSRKPWVFTACLRLEYLHAEKSQLNTQGERGLLELYPGAIQVGYLQHEDYMESSSAPKLFSPQGALTRAWTLQHILTLTAISTIYLDKQISLWIVFWGQ